MGNQKLLEIIEKLKHWLNRMEDHRSARWLSKIEKSIAVLFGKLDRWLNSLNEDRRSAQLIKRITDENREKWAEEMYAKTFNDTQMKQQPSPEFILELTDEALGKSDAHRLHRAAIKGDLEMAKQIVALPNMQEQKKHPSRHSIRDKLATAKAECAQRDTGASPKQKDREKSVER